jgi:hypothetical protein
MVLRLVIILPVLGIDKDVLASIRIILVVAQDMLVIIALPDGEAGSAADDINAPGRKRF